MLRLLDCHSSILRQEMARQPREECGAAGAKCRSAVDLEVSRLQLPTRREARARSLLVQKGDRPETYPWITSPYLWTDLFQASGYLPTSMLIDVPCGTLSTMHIDGTFPDLLLWQAYFDQTMQ